MPITVLLADDGEVIRRAISRLLRTHSALRLLGEASNVAETIELAKDLKPQVIVIDLNIWKDGRRDGLDLKSSLSHAPKLLAISLDKGEGARNLAAGLGAVKLLDKMNLYDELIPSIIELLG